MQNINVCYIIYVFEDSVEKTRFNKKIILENTHS